MYADAESSLQNNSKNRIVFCFLVCSIRVHATALHVQHGNIAFENLMIDI